MPHNAETLHLTAMPHHLDVAVISYKFSELRQQGDHDHIVELDPVAISELDFKRLFYYTHHNHNAFCVNKQYPPGKESLFNEFVSFSCQSVCRKLFSLSDEILDNIEMDLGISRHMLSTCSLINLTKELNTIRTLRDLPTANVTCSLKWSDIVETLRSRFRDNEDHWNAFYDGNFAETASTTDGIVTYKLSDTDSTVVMYDTVNPNEGISIGQPRPYYLAGNAKVYLTEEQATKVVRVVSEYEMPDEVPVVLSISVIFITPNEGVSPTVVKFNYATSVSIKVAEKC